MKNKYNKKKQKNNKNKLLFSILITIFVCSLNTLSANSSSVIFPVLVAFCLQYLVKWFLINS